MSSCTHDRAGLFKGAAMSEPAKSGSENELALREPKFIHLRIHSAYSLLEGALPVSKIIQFAESKKSPAIAITDTGNLFGALEFAVKASGAGIQPIIGCQLDICFDQGDEDNQNTTQLSAADKNQTKASEPIVLIAASEAGYANLVRLVSLAYLAPEALDGTYLLPEWLKEHAEGIICLTGGALGPIGSALSSGHEKLAQQRLSFFKETFGDRLYLEVQRPAGYSRKIEAATLDLAYKHDIPLVATNEAFFKEQDVVINGEPESFIFDADSGKRMESRHPR